MPCAMSLLGGIPAVMLLWGWVSIPGPMSFLGVGMPGPMSFVGCQYFRYIPFPPVRYTPKGTTPLCWHLVVATEAGGMHPTGMLSCYCPQSLWRLCFHRCLSVQRGVSATHPQWADTSLGRHLLMQTPPSRHPLPSEFWDTYPSGQTPPGLTLPGRPPWPDTPRADTSLPSACWNTHTLLPSACWDTCPCMLAYTHQCPVHAGIRSTGGRYTSHSNAFLYEVYVCYCGSWGWCCTWFTERVLRTTIVRESQITRLICFIRDSSECVICWGKKEMEPIHFDGCICSPWRSSYDPYLRNCGDIFCAALSWLAPR